MNEFILYEIKLLDLYNKLDCIFHHRYIYIYSSKSNSLLVNDIESEIDSRN